MSGDDSKIIITLFSKIQFLLYALNFILSICSKKKVQMPRLQLVIPETFVYSTRLQVRVGDLASGFHLGNHHLIAYLNEATLRKSSAR